MKCKKRSTLILTNLVNFYKKNINYRPRWLKHLRKTYELSKMSSTQNVGIMRGLRKGSKNIMYFCVEFACATFGPLHHAFTQASLMDIHHNTSFRYILEDDFISSASKVRIYSCLGKGTRLWLIAKPSIHSFYTLYGEIGGMPLC